MDKNVVEWSHNLIKRCDKPVYNSRGSVPVVELVCSLIKKSEVIARKAVVIECLGPGEENVTRKNSLLLLERLLCENCVHLGRRVTEGAIHIICKRVQFVKIY